MKSKACPRNKAMFFTKKIKENGKSHLKDEKTVTIGRLGEDAAVEFLKKNGYTVIERNYRAGRNEIDIIATDKGYIVFVEVKARTYKNNEGYMPYGRPSAAVDRSKKQRTVAAATKYLSKHNTKGKQPRIDVIEIYFASSPDFANTKEVTKINHIVNAFGARN